MDYNEFKFNEVPFSMQTPERQKERLAYLRHRVRVASYAILFLHLLKKKVAQDDEIEMSRKHNSVLVDPNIRSEPKSETRKSLSTTVKTLWHCLTSLALWFNLITSPFVMMWPEMA